MQPVFGCPDYKNAEPFAMKKLMKKMIEKPTASMPLTSEIERRLFVCCQVYGVQGGRSTVSRRVNTCSFGHKSIPVRSLLTVSPFGPAYLQIRSDK